MKLTRNSDGSLSIDGTADELRDLLAPLKDAIGRMVAQGPPSAAVYLELMGLGLGRTGITPQDPVAMAHS